MVMISYFISEIHVSFILQFCDSENNDFYHKNDQLFPFYALNLPEERRTIYLIAYINDTLHNYN